MSTLAFFLIMSLPCQTVMARLQAAKTYGEAARILEVEKLNKEQLAFWARMFHMPFANQTEFKFHLELLEEARIRMGR